MKTTQLEIRQFHGCAALHFMDENPLPRAAFREREVGDVDQLVHASRQDVECAFSIGNYLMPKDPDLTSSQVDCDED